MLLDVFYSRNDEPKINQVKDYFKAEEVKRVDSFTTDLVRTSPHMYGYLVNKKGKSFVVILDQYWKSEVSDSSKDFVLLYPGQSITSLDEETIKRIIGKSPMHLQKSDFSKKYSAEVHHNDEVSTVTVFKLKANNSENLMWINEDLQQILTYKEGKRTLQDF
ncbi:hypothetical protein [Paenibacillus zeisoli]|nr:hypothetical protein [Paenibacillus zeisoli]